MVSSRSNINQILTASVLNIPLRSDTVKITVTSPPYHNAINYEKHVEKGGWYRGNQSTTLDEYFSQMITAFGEVFRVTADSGFCCIVIGNELSDGTMIPLPHLLTQKLCKPNGDWQFHEEIIWNKITGGLDRFGVTIQRPYPSYYRANIMHEHILVLRKGKLIHQKDKASKLTIDDVMKKDISNSVWNIAPVPPRFIDHPCPFPEEVPVRLISLYSNKGDLVLDPFVGSGQTGKAAKYLTRKFVGFDIQPVYARLAKSRIDNEALHIRPQLVAKWEKILPK